MRFRGPLIVAISVATLLGVTLTFGGFGLSAAAPVTTASIVLDPNTITNSDAWTPDPPQENPGGAPGITQRFVHRDSTAAIAKSRTILTTIQFLPDHDAATRSTAASENSMNNWLANTETQQVPLGDGGSWLSGLIPDTYQYLQAIYFTVGNAAVSLQLAGAYASGPNLDAAPGIDSAGGGFVFNYAAGQAALLKNNPAAHG